MGGIRFESSAEPTLGIEIELALVDLETGALSSSAQQILRALPPGDDAKVKPELMQCYLEINTGVAHTVAEAGADLRMRLATVEAIADDLGVGLYWTGTHPFSIWQDQVVTPKERYQGLLDLLQDIGRQLVTFGLHVHVGVDSGDKAIMICERLMRHLPLLLALSANSPWWNDRRTGLLSHRSKIMGDLPTAGLPPIMRNWSEYVWLVTHLEETDFIQSIRDIWWVVRPHHNFGTVEVRVCDMPGRLEDVLAIAALIQSLVCTLSDEIDGGAYQHDCHPMLVRQNLWRAERMGLEAKLIDALTHEAQPVRDAIRTLVRDVKPKAEQLGCAQELALVEALAAGPTWAERQVEGFETAESRASYVRAAVAGSRVSAPRARAGSPAAD